MMGKRGVFRYLSLILPVLLLAATTACRSRHLASSTPSTLPAAVPYSGGETGCDHPFFPLRSGAYWEYETTAGSVISWHVTDIEDDSSGATATVSRVLDFQSPDAPSPIPYPLTMQCDASGLAPFVETSPYIGFPYPVSSMLLVERTLHLPAVELLQPGYSWEGNSYEMGEGGGMNDVVNVWTEAYTVTAAEPVILDGQMYDGLQITKEFANRASGSPYIAIRKHKVDILTEGTVVFTLARGIGVVQATTTYREQDMMDEQAQSTPTSARVNQINLIKFNIP